MSEEASHASSEHEKTAHVDQAPIQQGLGQGLYAPEVLLPPATPTALPGDPRLNGRGNQPMRIAAMQRMQQTHGNRALGRLLQRVANYTPIAQPLPDLQTKETSKEADKLPEQPVGELEAVALMEEEGAPSAMLPGSTNMQPLQRQVSGATSLVSVQRQDPPGGGGSQGAGGAGGGTTTADPQGGQGGGSGTQNAGTERALIDEALKTKDKADIKKIRNFGLATDGEKFEFINILLGGWTGPNDEYAIEDIWRSFPNLEATASANIGVWDKCVEAGAELDDFPQIKAMRARFEREVIETTMQFTFENRKFVMGEIKRLGLDKKDVGPTAEEGKEIQATQEAAKYVAEAQKAQDGLRNIPVGYIVSEDFTLGHQREPLAGGVRISEKPFYFDPGMKPEKPPKGTESPAFADYDKIHKQYDELEKVIRVLTNKYPALYAIVQHGSGDASAKQVSEETPEKARESFSKGLNEVLQNIDKTVPKIGKDVPWYDMKPVHAQLQKGGYWSGDLQKWVVNNAIEDEESTDFWISAGLGTAAAAAFMVASIATGGAAAIALLVGAAAVGTQLTIDWTKYNDLNQASKTNVSDDTAIIDKGTVNAALVTAILDTAFAVLDAFGAVGRAAVLIRGGNVVVKEAAQAGLKKAGLEALKDLRNLERKEAVTLVERAVNEIGVEQTAKQSGMTADDLAKMVGKDTELGERIAASAALKATDLKKGFEGILDGSIKGAAAEEIVSNAISKLGPAETLKMGGGWKSLSAKMGADSAAGAKLVGWRDALYKDLEEFMVTTVEQGKNAEEVIKSTGSKGFGSDLDISLLGENASANRDKARSFLAGRAGVSPDEMGRVLYTDIFTDPRRMHLYDALTPEVRNKIAKQSAGFEQELLWNKRLFEAEQMGNRKLVQQVEEDMASQGVKKVPYKPLAAEDIVAANKQIDALHKQLSEVANKVPPDTAALERIITDISQRQALINATESGGYFSGGGVRKFVSEAEQFPGFKPGQGAPRLPAQQLGAALDQLAKLDASIAKFKFPKKPGDLEAAIKEIGKYGERFTGVAKEALGAGVPGGSNFDEMAETFQKLLNQAKGKGDKTLQERLAREADRVMGEVNGALSQLEASSNTVIMELQAQAELATVEGGVANMQRIIANHGMLVRAKDATLQQLRLAIEAIKNGSIATLEGEEAAPAPDAPPDKPEGK